MRAAAVEAVWMVMSVGQVPASEPVLNQVNSALLAGLSDPDRPCGLQRFRSGYDRPEAGRRTTQALVAALEDGSDKNRDAAALALTCFHRGLARLLPSLVRSLDVGRERSVRNS